jgi:hypothetical protein
MLFHLNFLLSADYTILRVLYTLPEIHFTLILISVSRERLGTDWRAERSNFYSQQEPRFHCSLQRPCSLWGPPSLLYRVIVRSGHVAYCHLAASLRLRGALLHQTSSWFGLLVKRRENVSFYTVSQISVSPACRKGGCVSFSFY